MAGEDETADGAALLATLMRRAEAAPGDYQANRDLGLALAARRPLLLRAQPFLETALASPWAGGEDLARMALALADILSLQGRFADAITRLRQAIARCPQVPTLVYVLGDLLLRVGRINQASDLWQRAVRLQHDAARRGAAARGKMPVHILVPNLLTLYFFGELAARLDLWIKAQRLGLIAPARTLLLAPPGSIAHPALLDYWRPFIEVVEDPAEIACWEDQYRDSFVFLDYVPLPDGRTLRRDLAHAAVHLLWEDRGHAPLLSPAPAQAEQARALLRAQGMPDDAWFVCLHVREAGFHQDTASWSLNRHRNADVMSYMPAVRAITARGGWVVRIGDPSMRPLPEMPRCIDYAHADWRAPWVDLALIGSARFFLGMPTGPYSVAMAFGVPVLGTNWFPLGFWPFCSGDMLLPKRLVRRDGTPLSLSQSLRPPFFGGLEPRVFEAAGLDIADNTAEEIREAVEEMLDRLDGRPPSDPRAEALHDGFCAAADPHGVGLRARLPLAFLRRHPELAG